MNTSGGEKQQSFPIDCANLCGYYGSAATNNLCSKCYKAFTRMKQQGVATDQSIKTEPPTMSPQLGTAPAQLSGVNSSSASFETSVLNGTSSLELKHEGNVVLCATASQLPTGQQFCSTAEVTTSAAAVPLSSELKEQGPQNQGLSAEGVRNTGARAVGIGGYNNNNINSNAVSSSTAGQTSRAASSSYLPEGSESSPLVQMLIAASYNNPLEEPRCDSGRKSPLPVHSSVSSSSSPSPCGVPSSDDSSCVPAGRSSIYSSSVAVGNQDTNDPGDVLPNQESSSVTGSSTNYDYNMKEMESSGLPLFNSMLPSISSSSSTTSQDDNGPPSTTIPVPEKDDDLSTGLDGQIGVVPTSNWSSQAAPIVSNGDSFKEPTSSTTSSSAATSAAINNVQVNRGRCYQCKKKVGLLGFQCRCGFIFCGTHRHADLHSCAFDFKAFGKQQLRQANQKVVADKLTKI